MPKDGGKQGVLTRDRRPYQKNQKPIIERKRRARVNELTQQLRMMVQADRNVIKDSSSRTIEKAEIMERTVVKVAAQTENRVQNIQDKEIFIHGFLSCLEVALSQLDPTVYSEERSRLTQVMADSLERSCTHRESEHLLKSTQNSTGNNATPISASGTPSLPYSPAIGQFSVLDTPPTTPRSILNGVDISTMYNVLPNPYNSSVFNTPPVTPVQKPIIRRPIATKPIPYYPGLPLPPK